MAESPSGISWFITVNIITDFEVEYNEEEDFFG